VIRNGDKSARRLRHLVDTGKWSEAGPAWAVRRALDEVQGTIGLYDVETGGMYGSQA
jgi:hypothetical protein